MNQQLISYWIRASRPFTLPASISPVAIGTAFAFRDDSLSLVPALLCLLVAVAAQIASNFANDYFDFLNGSDTSERIGPARAVASGWIPARSMLAATIITLAFVCLCGLCIVAIAGWELLAAGVAIVACVVAYSAGPWPLSRHGLGDACVFLFYGIIPTCLTYYAQAMRFSLPLLPLAAATGLLAVNILVANNCRDYEEDRRSGKRTTIVMFGLRFGRALYMFNCIVALVILLPLILSSSLWYLVPYAAVAVLFFNSWRNLCRLSGAGLIPSLKHASRNLLLYTLLAVLAIVGSAHS
ncbi:MAG: 1,4-dihydroxy-2-naphthoate octaprenyltransferase [Tannerellaceae bacterium]|jgi:1,4-dihydroxy-2-naphthoate octaprenyltransferase|nr:1,4-dihydroxy-2-naphthoate octaprenyltransferase [Tannerellaceae bacterium]